MQTTSYGKAIKKKLIDLDKTQVWLMREITERTGLFIDSSYLNRICSGKANSARIKAAINEILELDLSESA